MCELNFHFNFALDKCLVLDEFRNCVLEGSKSLDNFYTLSPPYICHKGIVDDVNAFSEFSKGEVVTALLREL